MGPAEMARVGIYREIAWWLSFTYYSMNTRQATTNRRWSELQAVPKCTENNNFILTFSPNKTSFRKYDIT